MDPLKSKLSQLLLLAYLKKGQSPSNLWMSLMKSKILLNSFPLRKLSHSDRRYQFNIKMMEYRQSKFKINLKNSRKELAWMKVAAEKWQ